MILSAPVMESHDSCQRKWAWLRDWELIRVKPVEAVYAGIRAVMVAVEYEGPQVARQTVMDLAGTRGVWTDRHDPYDMMVHYGYMAEIIGRVLRQPSDPPRERHPKVDQWQPQAYLVDGGTRLMRVILADHWDDDRQLAECHAWRTMGDVCVTGLPMTLRVVVIGQSRNGRRYSHWTRARQHPVNKSIRFQRRHSRGEGFTGSWKNVWREESNIGPDAWLGQMARDGVLGDAAFNVNVKVPGEYARARVLEDVARIGEWMQRNRDKDGDDFPMNRSACDSPLHGPCPCQCICFANRKIGPGETHAFQKRDGARGETGYINK